MAEKALGRGWKRITSISMIASMLGFAISYIIYVKTLIPHLLLIIVYPNYSAFEPDPLPEVIGNGRWTGQVFWALVYTIFFAFPISLPRNLHSLRFTSLLGIICAIYLSLVIPALFFFD